MTDNTRRGKLVDLRTDRQREQAQEHMAVDLELFAASILADYTDAEVTIQDDNTAQRMPDIRIDYADNRKGFVEVWKDVDRRYAELTQAVGEGRYELAAESINRLWLIDASGAFSFRRNATELLQILGGLEERGLVFGTIGTFEMLRDHANPDVRRAVELGVVNISSRALQSGESAKVVIGPHGIQGPGGIDWEAFLGWVREHLAGDSKHMVGNRRKLADSGGDERHAFIGISYTTEWHVFQALTFWTNELPPGPPALPNEITHLWLTNYQAPERCLGWSPDLGWFDASARWGA
ncbi:hypothetical protein ABIA32_006140 [Streptacidiphilus sp. MAP12-20]|uniref:hypothetical protein n=1 Tax=Streptacidiphilus sp. MAP12-20 TaxID=3156299 RepID=UPI003511FF11